MSRCATSENYRQFSTEPRELINGKMSRIRRNHVTIPPDAHPMVQFIYAEIERQGLCIGDVADLVGVPYKTISSWRSKHNPNLENLQACLNVLGFQLSVEKLDEDASHRNSCDLHLAASKGSF